MFPLSIQKALAIAANNRTGTIQDVEHVVILMQENRSFDNYFGTLRGVRGFGDRFTIPLPDNKSVWEQTNDNNEIIAPYRLDQTQGNAQRIRMTPHSWVDAQDAWDKGRMSHWPKHKYDESMAHFSRDEIPFQFALAEAFTLCDAYHCSLHGGTNTNRLFHWSGTNGANIKKPLPVNNRYDSLSDKDYIGYNWTTYPERLEQKGISWKVYQNLPDNFTDNPLAGFKQYRRAFKNIGKKQEAVYDHSLNASEPLYKGIANTLPMDSNKPDYGLLDGFKQDIANGKLPQVSWLIAPEAYSEHPGPSSPVQGAWYVQSVLDALTDNPDIWSKTVFLVNYDENDGYFDHLPPPCAPSEHSFKEFGKSTLGKRSTEEERYSLLKPRVIGMPWPNNGVFGPGPRVPMFVISPWSRGGWVNSETFDHTSVLQFLEARFGIEEPNISAFRRSICGDLTSAFDFANPDNAAFIELSGRTTRNQADTLRNSQQNKQAIAIPKTGDKPIQEQGSRPSRALPYELHTHLVSNQKTQQVTIFFSNTGKKGAVFHVYDKLNLQAPPKRYVVEAGKQLSDQWESKRGEYDLWVLSHNGFHRHFTGEIDEQGKQTEPEIKVCYNVIDGNVHLTLDNLNTQKRTFRIEDQAYFNKEIWHVSLDSQAKHTQEWILCDCGRWYDFIVTCEELPRWQRRFAGRVETGKHGISDPAMGMIS